MNFYGGIMDKPEFLKHTFFDKDIEYAMIGPYTIELGIKEDQSAILLNKTDVEALAKWFGIIS
jgi:hypothetical protein